MLVHVLHIDGSVQDCSISIANALEILQSCTNPSICKYFLRMHITSIPLLCAQISYKFLSVVAPFIGLFLQLYDWNKWIWIFLSMRYPKCCMVYSPYALFCCPLFIFFHLTSLFYSAVCMKLNIYTHIDGKYANTLKIMMISSMYCASLMFVEFAPDSDVHVFVWSRHYGVTHIYVDIYVYHYCFDRTFAHVRMT